MTDARVPSGHRRWSGSDALCCGVVVGLAVCWGALFGWLAARNHANYGTWAYDLAIYDQAFWVISRGETFLSVRGLPVWGHHLNAVGILFAPAYWLGAGATFLVVVQAFVVGAAGIPLWFIARLRLGGGLAAAGVSVAYLLYTPVQFLVWRDFHPEAMVATAMLGAWYCALTGRWRWFAAALVLAVSMREDAALAVAVLGAVMWWWGWRRRVAAAGEWRRSGALTLAGGAGYYLLATLVLLPLANGGNGAFYLSYFYGEWGGSLPRILGNVVVHPDWLWRDATAPDRLRFYRDLLTPVGYLPLLSPSTLAIAGPQLFGSVISSQPYPRSVMYQYTAVMIAPIMIATVEGVRRLAGWLSALVRRRHREHRLAMAVVVVLLGCALVTNAAWSLSPIGAHFDAAWGRDNPRRAQLDDAVASVPADASTSSTYNLTPHLAQRRWAFDWPNPWVPLYYGNAIPFEADCAALIDADIVDYLVLDLELVGEDGYQLVTAMTGPRGDFEVLSLEAGVLVARRRAPGPAGTPLQPNCSTSFAPVLAAYRAAEAS